MEPPPKSYHPLKNILVYSDEYARSASGPSQRSQFRPSGTGVVSVGSVGNCGHTGRLVQLCTSFSLPILPSFIHSITWSILPLESQGIRWVTTLGFWRANSITALPSNRRLDTGFCINTCLFLFKAAMAKS